ncbi:hypothetical protein PIIN_06960 [Serendipita indica DSM 11827]|uniref:Uncharacterized protein n=1 Tax=Serendipita indica (strain DSM 11827) TaxID=1109443 RepID=G4TNW2_SERID|nr:hypothetical protein PIIN_06960 [Serendipita indica DSM 11827]
MFGIAAAISTCTESTALRLAEEFRKHSLLDALFDIIDYSHHDPSKGCIFYYEALFAISQIFKALSRLSKVKEDLATKLIEDGLEQLR